jgi:lipopolysaccharide transport system permease protein
MDAAIRPNAPHSSTVELDPASPPAGTVSQAPAVTYLDPERSIRRFVSEAWHSRHLLAPLSFNVISRMYARTYLGRSWVFIRPAMDAAGGAILFGGVLGVRSGDGTPYLLFLMAGLVGWRGFERTVFWATRSFDRLRRISGKLDMPLLLVPLAGCAPALVDLAVYLLVLVLVILGFLAAEGRLWLELSPELLAAVGGLLLCVVFGVAIGLWTSVLNAHTRDVRHVLRYVMQIWMFATPVIYPITKLPPDFRPFAQANPIAAPIELIKHGLLGSGDVQLVPVVWSCVAACLFVGAGLWFFSRRASNFMGPAGWEADDDEDVLY